MLVAEDEAPLRAALCDLIAWADGLEVAGVAADADEAIACATGTQPDVALLDVRMPGGGGPRAARVIATVSPATRSVAISAYDDRSTVFEMLAAGAVGYVVKGESPDEILEAVRRAARGQSSFSASIAAELVESISNDPATPVHGAVIHGDDGRFEELLESAPDAVAIVDASGAITLVNAQTERLFGYRRDELVGRQIELLVPSRSHSRHEQLRATYVDHPSTRPMGTGLQLAGRRKDGSEFPVDISLSTVESDDGRITTAFIRDITDRTARERLERTIAERRAVLAHVVAGGEEERRRIAADIHDDSIQVMTAAGMRMQILRRSITDEKQLERLNDVEQTIHLSITRLRHLIFELRPPALDNEGLSAAIRAYIDGSMNSNGTAFAFDDRLRSQPGASTRVIVYRIVQEVLTNVRKHANATNVSLTFESRDGGCYVRVHDDGVGFAPESAIAKPGHLGLAAIRERAELAGGWLKVVSAPGEGATIELWVATDQLADGDAT